MENTLTKIKSLYPLSDSALAKLTGLFYKRHFKKGELILKEGRIERSVFFIEKGIARAYSDLPTQELTFWLGAEGDYIISAQSLINNKPGYETIEVLEDSVLYEIDSAAMIALFESDIELANWSRKLAEHELIKLEQRFIFRQFKTAAQMYADILENNPTLLQRVPLKHIASYLGISQVSLSRIRAEIK
ncbi:cyclic nucleotide-binding protein [Flavobacterium rivuli WB 3.3-2 = DSM 21788]|uniref:Cyclic nucleotide-binding protein n=1 Tax=Flavobacterium rivuli WB 3.3-2 = DSM 21788 TaxID=1121895 RepID=A0A0A2M4S9_9FLAO|nr:Crp/Fnr family transcriptional regulator [Flavobacterium rivuli]KGO86468.1 cyclic nucleotide-binding protein [Flavobacterium rivuli WB 3.3-2 = DSM 21788]